MTGIICSMVGASFAVAATGRTAKTITPNGNAQISTAQSKFGGSSYLGDGTSDNLALPTNASVTGPFTIECFVRFNTAPGARPNTNWQMLYAGKDSNTYWLLYSNYCQIALGGKYGAFNFGSTMTTGTWYHLAFVRHNSDYKIYFNGTDCGTAVDDGNWSTRDGAFDFFGTGVNYIGDYSAFTRGINGYIDEFRISNVARYTANFTPPASRFNNDANTLLLIHADGTNGSTTFTDDTGSTPATGVRFERVNSEKIVVSSWATKPTNNKVQVVSMWLKFASLPSTAATFWCPFMAPDLSDGNLTVGFFVDNSNRFRHYSHYRTGFMDTTYTPSPALANNTWYHVVAKNNGTGSGRTQMWVNGVRVIDAAATNIGTANFLYSNVNQYNIAADNFSNRWWHDGCIEQLYWYAGDIDLDANISKFYNNGWVDMGPKGSGSGLPAPHIYHIGDTQAGFAGLKGSTTGTATVTGTLSACV